MPQGDLVSHGKTKEVRIYDDSGKPAIVEIYSLDDLTAGNGAKHDVLPGKGELATTTTCNVFLYLRQRDEYLMIAYRGRSGPRTFHALECRMIPLEVVIRRFAEGSYLKRNPYAKAGERFKSLEVEFYLKTSGKKWVGKDGVEYALPVDDPLLVFDTKDGRLVGFTVHEPGKPVDHANPLFSVSFEDVDLPAEYVSRVMTYAERTFTLLEQAWWFAATARLKDMKIEFGWSGDPGRTQPPGQLFLADVIDNDSWRLEIDGEEVSKEIYRRGAPLDQVLKAYQKVAKFTERFKDHPGISEERKYHF